MNTIFFYFVPEQAEEGGQVKSISSELVSPLYVLDKIEDETKKNNFGRILHQEPSITCTYTTLHICNYIFKIIPGSDSARSQVDCLYNCDGCRYNVFDRIVPIYILSSHAWECLLPIPLLVCYQNWDTHSEWKMIYQFRFKFILLWEYFLCIKTFCIHLFSGEPYVL